MTPTLIDISVHGPVLQIVLRRDQKLNAMNRELADALDTALNQLEDDPALHAGVLTGSAKAFCAGSDLGSNGDYVTPRGGEYGLIRRRRAKPLIAAVEGIAYGGGMEIALACDLVVAARNARFALPEVCRGVLPTCGALFRGPRALPPNVLRELVLTGEPLDAERAHALGFVNSLALPGEALQVALAMAQRIAVNAPVAVRTSLAAIAAATARDDERGWYETDSARDRIVATEDAREGVRAFLEKREPRWSNR